MAKRALPPLSTLRVFEACARLKSFKGAAAELNLTQSAVSHQIAALERRLGTRLFDRLPGGVALNAWGETYHPAIRDAFDGIATATALVERRAQNATLVVQVYVTVAVRWLIPRLHLFREAFPAIAINVDASSLEWDFNPEKADVGIVYVLDQQRSGIDYTLLRRERLVAVCAPDLAGSIEKAADLACIPRLSLTGGDTDWRIWCSAVEMDSRGDRLTHSFDSYLLAIEAAVDGQGFAVVPQFLVAGDIHAGKLAIAWPSDVMQPGAWFLAHARGRTEEPTIRSFRNWITSPDHSPVGLR